MKITTKRIDEFNIAAQRFEKEDSKFTYAIKRMRKRFESIIEAYQSEVEELRINHCSVDDKGNVLREADGNFKFTKDALKALSKDLKELNKKEYEIEPYISTFIPDDLTEDEIEAFEGLILYKSHIEDKLIASVSSDSE